ncbi:MAG: transposase [Spirochaetota bacterium]|jgi:transposase
MKYSRRMKESVLRKVLPPENRSVSEVALEMGISDQTIYGWKRQAEKGTLSLEDLGSPRETVQLERYNLIMESKSIGEEGLGAWLRGKGLHSEHLSLWQQEIQDTLSNKDTHLMEENRRLKKEKKELERELRRKEKALAEMAALVTLKKKAEAIWGDKGDE